MRRISTGSSGSSACIGWAVMCTIIPHLGQEYADTLGRLCSPSLAANRRRGHPVGQVGEVIVVLAGGQRQPGSQDPPGQQRRPRAEQDRCDAQLDLVQETPVGELPGQVAAAGQPDVPPAALVISACTAPTSSRVMTMRAPGTGGSGRWVNTQHGTSP